MKQDRAASAVKLWQGTEQRHGNNRKGKSQTEESAQDGGQF